MGTITGFTAEYIQAVLDGTIEDANVVGDDLVFTRTDGTTFNVGSVRGPQGIQGVPGPTSIAVVTSGTRPGSPFEGLMIYETDTDRMYTWNGTAWVFRSGVFVVTSITRPAGPPEGMVIYETDTDRFYVYTGTAWRAFANQKYTLAGKRADSAANGASTDTAAIAFGVTFAAIPVVSAVVENASNAQMILSIHDVTTTGFNYTVYNRDSGGSWSQIHNYTIHWVAVGDLA